MITAALILAFLIVGAIKSVLDKDDTTNVDVPNLINQVGQQIDVLQQEFEKEDEPVSPPVVPGDPMISETTAIAPSQTPVADVSTQ